MTEPLTANGVGACQVNMSGGLPPASAVKSLSPQLCWPVRTLMPAFFSSNRRDAAFRALTWMSGVHPHQKSIVVSPCFGAAGAAAAEVACACVGAAGAGVGGAASAGLVGAAVGAGAAVGGAAGAAVGAAGAEQATSAPVVASPASPAMNRRRDAVDFPSHSMVFLRV